MRQDRIKEVLLHALVDPDHRDVLPEVFQTLIPKTLFPGSSVDRLLDRMAEAVVGHLTAENVGKFEGGTVLEFPCVEPVSRAVL